MTRLLRYTLLLLAAVLGSGCTAGAPPARTAILGAFGPEGRRIEQSMTDRRVESVRGVRVVVGRLEGRPVVLAKTGVGKVNAAMTTALILDRYQPSEVIFSGIAGGLSNRVHPGDIVIAQKITQHDYGFLSNEGLEHQAPTDPTTSRPHPLYLSPDERLYRLAQQVAAEASFLTLRTTQGQRRPSVISGTIVTGDVFVAATGKKNELQKNFQADAVEMEGAAVAQVAAQLRVPWLVIRSISDMADESATADMEAFRDAAAHNSATLVTAVVKKLAGP